jgi:GxxExxY protein
MLVYETGLGERVIGLGIEVHRALGPGLLESLYEECLCQELRAADIEFVRQAPLSVTYKGTRLDRGYRMDIVVAKEVLVEVKAVDRLLPIHDAQVLTCLKLSGLKVGFLMNFNSVLLKDGLRRLVL